MDSLNFFINQQFIEAQTLLNTFINNTENTLILNSICQSSVNAFNNHKKILIAGNGGSAADAQHFAGELVSRFYFDRPALPAIALTTDSSIMTAIGNDYGYDMLFERQIEAHGQPGDIFIGLSTSGNSPNIIRALKAAKKLDMITVGLTGEKVGQMDPLCDYLLKVPSSVTPRIQEIHELICHTICASIEKVIFGKPS